MLRLGTSVFMLARAMVVLPVSTSKLVTGRASSATPTPVEAFPCGSRSRISTFSPTAASAVPRLMAVVVLPTPPFWLAMARTRSELAAGMSVLRFAFKIRDHGDAAVAVGDAGDQLNIEIPGLFSRLQLFGDALSFAQ